jgi:hypothetical protein
MSRQERGWTTALRWHKSARRTHRS